MDRVVKLTSKEKYKKKIKLTLFYFIVFLGLPIVVFALSPSTGTYSINIEDLELYTVTNKSVDSAILLRAEVTPKKRYYIDASTGGVVKTKFVEEGQLVNKGDKIVELKNSSLQLGVITREAQITEQLNNLQNTKLAMAQDSLNLQNFDVEYSYRIKMLERDIKNKKKLLSNKLISEDDYLKTSDELEYYKKKLNLNRLRIDETKKLRLVQLEQLEKSTERLNNNLNLTIQSLDELVIRAPVTGILTTFELKVGESLSSNERVAHLDDLTAYKLESNVDEYYFGDLKLGLNAKTEFLGKEYKLILSKIYPKIENNQVKVEFTFEDNSLFENLYKGQSLPVTLSFSQPKTSLAIPRGAYEKYTGGKWLFVINENEQDIAKKVDVITGVKNNDFLEIKSGISAGDLVVISSYSQLVDYETITINR
ncbi:efflux RND transporter periplasmic adaptor subunit [Pseudoalteromonas sp. HF66]|uniref:efflux RND transporter periplasmic adaptor subunit n=1 Tax=Pseudoalteromonas sp. HF66 TaxID=2721559 RepID=UPI00142F6499|nr:HlyD family efflux transporter periplasmic adaptor subunit [Pseudoalteromonas sp. HF66]NIZ06425.1 HlyD family efflux transporter periplasmic adaptor subunit [Pseudoalteromonas sp. HF66]